MCANCRKHTSCTHWTERMVHAYREVFLVLSSSIFRPSYRIPCRHGAPTWHSSLCTHSAHRSFKTHRVAMKRIPCMNHIIMGYISFRKTEQQIRMHRIFIRKSPTYEYMCKIEDSGALQQLYIDSRIWHIPIASTIFSQAEPRSFSFRYEVKVTADIHWQI